MSFKRLQDFIEIAKSAGASQLEFVDGEKKFSVSFPSANENIIVGVPQVHAYNNQQTVPPTTQESAEVENSSSGNCVKSPFVGTFYRSASPDTAAYANVGDKVSVGQVLCIVEAMKIMNEIEAEVAGEIVEISVENENYVEFDQVLFKIKPL